MSPTDIWIMCTGLLSIALLQFGKPWMRAAAPFVGLAGQPAWIVIAMAAGRPGVLVVTAAYTVLWVLGCWKVIAAARHKG